MVSRVLVVDDEPSICWGLRRLCESAGHEVTTVASAEHALMAIEEAAPDAIVLDVRLPGMSGLDAIPVIRQRAGTVPIIVITAHGDLETAVEATREGVFDYVLKPFDLETIERALVRALNCRGGLPPATDVTVRDGDIVGRSPAMQQVFKQIALAAPSDAGVLLSGESGTGKELAARAIHRYSRRASGPFVAVNVASLSASLAESELFGHVRGAFTGADELHVGLLVRANGGTLFLDEVADIPMSVQVKLLRALEQGEVVPVGGTEPVRTNFRVVSATHRDLMQQVGQAEFRHDLFFRLGAFHIALPPLRSRHEDIVPLAEHFLRTLGRTSPSVARLSVAAQQELQRRTWPGNVRELRNSLEHAIVVARGGLIEPEHLPPPMTLSLGAPTSHDYGSDSALGQAVGAWARRRLRDGDRDTELYAEFLSVAEPPLFEEVLAQYQGQCAAAARRLGLHRTTLRKKLDEQQSHRDH
jgi:two-component system nitrogen regulation response regulator GlnG